MILFFGDGADEMEWDEMTLSNYNNSELLDMKDKMSNAMLEIDREIRHRENGID